MYFKNLESHIGEIIRYAISILLLRSLSTNVTLVRAISPHLNSAFIDIRDLISLDDVQEELKYGPNGGLVYCMEYLIENIDWLMDEL